MVDIDDAILATTSIDPRSSSLGESEAGPATRTLTMRNKGSSPVTYDLVARACAVDRTEHVHAGVPHGLRVGDLQRAERHRAGGRHGLGVDVTITANAGARGLSQYGGYIAFTPQGRRAGYRVPYAGLKGDYQSKPVLTPTAAPDSRCSAS